MAYIFPLNTTKLVKELCEHCDKQLDPATMRMILVTNIDKDSMIASNTQVSYMNDFGNMEKPQKSSMLPVHEECLSDMQKKLTDKFIEQKRRGWMTQATRLLKSTLPLQLDQTTVKVLKNALIDYLMSQVEIHAVTVPAGNKVNEDDDSVVAFSLTVPGKGFEQVPFMPSTTFLKKNKAYWKPSFLTFAYAVVQFDISITISKHDGVVSLNKKTIQRVFVKLIAEQLSAYHGEDGTGIFCVIEDLDKIDKWEDWQGPFTTKAFVVLLNNSTDDEFIFSMAHTFSMLTPLEDEHSQYNSIRSRKRNRMEHLIEWLCMINCTKVLDEGSFSMDATAILNQREASAAVRFVVDVEGSRDYVNNNNHSSSNSNNTNVNVDVKRKVHSTYTIHCNNAPQTAYVYPVIVHQSAYMKACHDLGFKPQLDNWWTPASLRRDKNDPYENLLVAVAHDLPTPVAIYIGTNVKAIDQLQRQVQVLPKLYFTQMK